MQTSKDLSLPSQIPSAGRDTGRLNSVPVAFNLPLKRTVDCRPSMSGATALRALAPDLQRLQPPAAGQVDVVWLVRRMAQPEWASCLGVLGLQQDARAEGLQLGCRHPWQPKPSTANSIEKHAIEKNTGRVLKRVFELHPTRASWSARPHTATVLLAITPSSSTACHRCIPKSIGSPPRDLETKPASVPLKIRQPQASSQCRLCFTVSCDVIRVVCL